MRRVLLTDGDERATLAVTRALGQQGVEVVVGAEQSISLAAASKFCTDSFAYPSPFSDAAGYTQRLLEVAKGKKVDALFPMSDIAMHVIGPVKAVFEHHARVPIPDHAVFKAIADKYLLMKLAQELEVPIPETVFVNDGNIGSVLQNVKAFPVVIKPGCSIVKSGGGWRKTSVQYAQNEYEIQTLYRENEHLRESSLIQQRVVGEGRGVFALMNDGIPLALFAHKRLREKPPSGGVSVLRESIPLAKDLVEPALKLLRHVRWHGVAMVEFKIDSVTGIPFLMEINGRFWGSLQLAIDAGVNYPLLLLMMAMGESINVPDGSYRNGTRSRWVLGDLDHLLMRLLKSDKELDLPPGYCSKWQCFTEFVRGFIGSKCEIERIQDPAPWQHEWKRYVANVFGENESAGIRR